MEMKTSTVVAALVAAMMLVQTMALPMGQNGQTDQDKLMHADKRPKYMDTRDISYFKELLLTSLADLINDGVLSPSILSEARKVSMDDKMAPAEKRGGRHLGLCFHLTPSGNPSAVPCWINGR